MLGDFQRQSLTSFDQVWNKKSINVFATYFILIPKPKLHTTINWLFSKFLVQQSHRQKCSRISSPSSSSSPFETQNFIILSYKFVLQKQISKLTVLPHCNYNIMLKKFISYLLYIICKYNIIQNRVLMEKMEYIKSILRDVPHLKSIKFALEIYYFEL